MTIRVWSSGPIAESYPVQFEADVICLGHANNRPDRNAMMTALAQRFDVRTYGRGWEIPNSETVAGEQMVQALKAGRIHVNFPLTRAGFAPTTFTGGGTADGQFDLAVVHPDSHA